MPRQPEVAAWLERYDNPLKDVVQRVREIVLDADPRVDECIKWQAPTFTYKGNIASFYPKSRQHASLMFHLGAKIPGTYPRLEGTGERRGSSRSPTSGRPRRLAPSSSRSSALGATGATVTPGLRQAR